MTPVEVPVCLHCEKRPRSTGLGLCADCHTVKGIRLLYLKRRGWTPAWEQHLRRLTDRAKQRLPLFGPDLPDVPLRRCRPEESSEDRLARLLHKVHLPRKSPDSRE